MMTYQLELVFGGGRTGEKKGRRDEVLFLRGTDVAG